MPLHRTHRMRLSLAALPSIPLPHRTPGARVLCAVCCGCCSVIKFDKNACVLVNPKGLPIGTRVLGFVTHELRARHMMKVGWGGVRRPVLCCAASLPPAACRVWGGWQRCCCSCCCGCSLTHGSWMFWGLRGALEADEEASSVVSLHHRRASLPPALHALQVLSLAARVF